MRYKIKLVAANYLPAIVITLPHRQQATPVDRRAANKSMSAGAADEDSISGAMQAGLSYPFHLAITNPLYDPIQVRLSVQRMHVAPSAEGEKARRPPFAVSLPTTSFTIAAFAEAWEYDDEDEDIDMFGLDDDEIGLRPPREREKPKVKTVGVLEKRANLTVIGGEVVLGKEARGNVKVGSLSFHDRCTDDIYSSTCSSSISIDLTILHWRVVMGLIALRRRRDLRRRRRILSFILWLIWDLSFRGRIGRLRLMIFDFDDIVVPAPRSVRIYFP